MGDKTLFTTEIKASDFLSVGIRCVTIAEDCDTHWQLYYRYETWLGFMSDVVLHSDKVEGIHQEITIELLSLEVAEEVAKPFHDFGVMAGEKLTRVLEANTFITLGKGMGI